MAGRILQEDIDALKRRADLADIASDYTRMKKSGRRWKGLCPFHQEKTPSFTVDAEANLFHCFGCQAGGDLYSFVERVEGLSFTEAVEHVARRIGYELRYEEMSAAQKRALGLRSRLVGANETAADFYHAQLLSPDGEAARAYLKDRGFDREAAERFRLGFAPLDWQTMCDHLRSERYTEDEVERSGLGLRGRTGRMHDRFRGRLMFPVLDLSGDVIGFGGRVLPDLDYGDREPPKYLNTPETPVYHKSEVLYGMSWARPEVVRSSEVLVAEGYTDVMALHRAGFENAVATCGTAVGEDHFDLLERYAQRVVLAFDSDEAGERAAERAWELARSHELEVRVLVMPAGSDPADVVQRDGIEVVRELVEQAEPVVRFMLRRAATAHDDSPEGRATAVDDAAAILGGVADPVLREEYAHFVADLVGLSTRVVNEAVSVHAGTVEANGEEERGARSAHRSSPSRRAQLEREVLRVALQQPELLPDRWQEVTRDDFSHPRARGVYDALHAAGGPPTPLEDVLASCEDDDERGLVRAIALEDFTVVPDEPHVAEVVAQLLLRRIDREIDRRKSEIERMNPTVDRDAYMERFRELVALEGRRRDLAEQATG